MKKILLALVLAIVSSACVAQETQQWTRTQYIEKCREAAKKFKTPIHEADSVCSCAAQYVSFVTSGGETEWADYTLPLPSALAIDAIRYCRIAYQSNPPAFIEKFGTLSVNNEELEEGL